MTIEITNIVGFNGYIEAGGFIAVFDGNLLLTRGGEFAGGGAGEAAGDFSHGTVRISDFQHHAGGIERLTDIVGALGGERFDGNGGNRLVDGDIEACGLAAVADDDLLLTDDVELAVRAGEAAGDFLGGAVGISDLDLHAGRVKGVALGVDLLGGHGLDGNRRSGFFHGDIESCGFALVADDDLLLTHGAELAGGAGEAGGNFFCGVIGVSDLELESRAVEGLADRIGALGGHCLDGDGGNYLVDGDIESGGLAAKGDDDLLLTRRGELACGGIGEAGGNLLGGVVGIGDFELHARGVKGIAVVVNRLGGLGFDGNGRNRLFDGDIESGGLAAVADNDLLLSHGVELAGRIDEAGGNFLGGVVGVSDLELESRAVEGLAYRVRLLGGLFRDGNRGYCLIHRDVRACSESS